jgi:hypothetical protein
MSTESETPRPLEQTGGRASGYWLTSAEARAVASLARWSGRSVGECADALRSGRLPALIQEVRGVKGRMGVIDKLQWLNFRRIGWKMNRSAARRS